MTEKKTPSLKNQDWKKVKQETEKVNKLLSNIPNELIYVWAKQVCDKTWMGNFARRTGKESVITSESAKEGKTYRDMLGKTIS